MELLSATRMVSSVNFSADTGVWNPIRYTGSYNGPAGVNGFHLDFSDNSSDAALGTDSSGLNNTWTPNNLYAGDSKAGVTFDGTNDYLYFSNNLSDFVVRWRFLH